MASELFPERDCSTCTNIKKEQWGCNGDAKIPIEIDGEMSTTCIRRPMFDNPAWFNEVYTMYKMYKAGFLPNEGSYLAQPPSFLQLINVIDSTLADCDEIKQQEEDRKKRNKKRSGLNNGH